MPVEYALRENLLRDFGHDLPISGGWGASRTDPVVVQASDAQTVALAQMRVLDDLSRVRGVYWRSLARALLGPDWPGIEQYKYEVVELTETQIVTRLENRYFDVGALPASEWQPILPSVPVGDGRFPAELGWLHVGNPGTTAHHLPDMVLPYRAPGIEATLYVYGAPAPADIHDPVVVAHFEAAADMVLRREKDIVAWPDRPDPRMLERVFRVGPDAESATLLALTTARGHYVKMRVTWVRDRFVDRVAKDWVEAVLRFAGRGAAPH